MRHGLVIVSALLLPLALAAQNDTVRTMREAQTPERTQVTERSLYIEDTPELQKTPDSLARVEIATIQFFTDTFTQIAYIPDSTAMQRIDTIRPDSTDRRGHYVEAYAGIGFGSLGYGLRDPYCSTNGSFSAILQAQYAYFFTQNWGIGAGLWLTNYTSFANIGGTYIWRDQTDTDLEQHYDHTATVRRWKERETVHALGIPISAQFQYKKDSWKVRLFAAAGIAPSFAVSKRYRVLQGEVTHSGYYPGWDLNLEDMHEFGTKDYTKEPCAKGKMSVRSQVALFADCGALFPMTKQIELFVGGYFNCVLNDANSSEKKALGWKDDTFTFMEEYNGAYATNMASSSHPWELGVKVGIHWHYVAPDKHETVDYFDYFTRHDTLIQYIPRSDTTIVERIDTLTRAHIAKAAEEVEKFNKIYFDFDSYQLSAESQDYLASIVEVLNKVPDAKVSIDGHASEEGRKDYNERLAYNRAKAVAQFLIDNGLDEERVIVLGHGSLIPNEENVNHELPLDRRVEVKVVQKQSEIE